MRQDLRLAFRRLFHDPGFSITVMVILALTIGANIAVLSVVNTALVRPMPYPHPERLAELMMTIPGTNELDDSHDGETWEAVRDLTSVTDAAAYGLVSNVNLSAAGRAVSVRQARVSAGFFRVLGVPPALGREFDRAEDVPGGPALAILSHSLWLQQFGGAPNIVGRSVLLRGEPATVIGIMPAGFQSNTTAASHARSRIPAGKRCARRMCRSWLLSPESKDLTSTAIKKSHTLAWQVPLPRAFLLTPSVWCSGWLT